MRKLHPLRLKTGGSDTYSFLFSSLEGDREFEFFMFRNESNGVGEIGQEFSELTDGDMATRCIVNCICRFDKARVAGGAKNGSLTESGQPIAIEYKGECREGAFKYLVSLKDTDGSVHVEEVVVSYKDPENVLLWSGGQCSFGFDRMAMLEVKEPKPAFSDLLNAILQFDQSRYVPSYDNEEPMKIELP